MYAVMLTMVFMCIETMSFVAINLVKSRFVFQGVFYDASVVKQIEYRKKRDIILGWRPRPETTAADGTRPDPVFSIDAPPCLSLFGDSFTASADVDAKDAWGSILSAQLKCRVANFGVSGYGTDQAFLRFRSLPPKGEVVFLNHLSENIMRNVSQYFNLIYPTDGIHLKPRFIVRNGGLEVVPTPEVAARDLQRFLNDPALYLANEYFLPGGPSGVTAIKFPYSLAMFKAIFRNHHLYTQLTGIPRYAEFYRPEHPSHGLDVTYEILRSFAREAAARGQIPIVTFIPTCRDLVYFNTTGAFPYDRLTKMIAAQNIRYIDFGERIANRIKGSPPKNLYYKMCSSYSGYHFNEVGYRLLAEIAFEYLLSDSEIRRRLLTNATAVGGLDRGDGAR
jgi:hypothetical protein